MISIGHSMLERKEIRRIIKKNDTRIHFIGIGGASMSSLAELCLLYGLSVSGSDTKKTRVTDRLISEGISCSFTHSSENIQKIRPELVVYSLAIGRDNCELSEAMRLNIPVISRAQLLSAIAEDYGQVIAVSASHGKSTTVAMLHSILSVNGDLPTTLCGAELPSGECAAFGEREYLVLEACEYGRSFLLIRPHVQLLLNLELDHTDCYTTLDDISEAFLAAANNAKALCVVNADDENLKRLLPRMPKGTVAFSAQRGFDYRYQLGSERGRYGFSLFYGETLIMKCQLSVIGRHNAQNAVAAAVAAHALGIESSVISEALSSFRGIKRRLEFIGKRGNTDIIYDYAHHPSEIRAVLSALSESGYKKIAAVFAPHTYSRTKSFFGDFARALSDFHSVFLTEIYPAREAPLPGVTSRALAEAMLAIGGTAEMYNEASVLSYLDAEEPDCLVLMGAGELSRQMSCIINN